MLAEVEGEVERKAQEELQQKREQGDLGKHPLQISGQFENLIEDPTHRESQQC